MIAAIRRDLLELARASTQSSPTLRSMRGVLGQDAFAVLLTTRLRSVARRLRVPGVNHLLRLVQTALFGVEIGNDVQLGAGVYFVHPLGTVLGGDARIGERVRFLGNNTVGTARENGYPVIEHDVVVGCGARILGPVRIGAGAVIGANAVVLQDVPAGGLATGVPAVVRKTAGASYGPHSEVLS